jgi:hypothetical protein
MMRILKILAIALTFFIFFQCEEDDGVCQVQGSSEHLTNADGLLIFTDTLSGLKLNGSFYFILYDNSLPLEICNVPEDGYSFYTPQDSVPIVFSGNKQVLPETVDAFSEIVEIEEIREK